MSNHTDIECGHSEPPVSEAWHAEEDSEEASSTVVDAAVSIARHVKLSGSIRLNFIISSTDIGFEALYHELSKIELDADRAKHVKRLLHSICEGKPRNTPSPLTSLFALQQRSIKITFRLSGRDIGLEKLYNELAPMSVTFERNQYVRRMIFLALTNADAKPVAALQSALDPAAPTPTASPFPASQPATVESTFAPSGESRDRRRLAARKGALLVIGG
jgi:hypothetical protein